MNNMISNQPSQAPYVIQSVNWVHQETHQDLYYYSSGAKFDNGSITLKNSESVSFNTYFGSFYFDYWRRHGAIENVGLRLRFSGNLSVSVFRETGPWRRKTLFKQSLSAADSGEKILEIDHNNGKPGRIYFEIKGIGSGGQLLGCDFIALGNVTPRKVAFCIGICTFNRENQLMRNLKRLFDNAAALQNIQHSSG